MPPAFSIDPQGLLNLQLKAPRYVGVVLGLGLGLGWGLPGRSQTAIVPDETLGTENSTVREALVRGGMADLIEGGAARGSSLFHSFLEFGIGEGGRAYFANPSGIEMIFSRVTGLSESQINGVLGVDGTADLFLLNPNGILFGPNARLDISGSFYGSTAEKFVFGDGSAFSAVNPQVAPLLTVNPAAGGVGTRGVVEATIVNQGKLTAGENLTLEAGQLDLQGELQAGQNLTLRAQDTVKIRDTLTSPFLAQARGNLTVQGNQGIDILALNHLSQTPFVSGGNLSLISDGVISGDAHFASGGEFQIASLSGQLADFTSLYDPIISSVGDINVSGNYRGAALLVESMGNVRFNGTVTITGPDTTFSPTDPNPDLALLGSSAAFIVRSGVTSLAFAPTSLPTTRNSGTFQVGSSLPAGITLVGTVRTNGGATSGPVKLVANNGGITVNRIDTGNASGLDSGTIDLIAQGDISVSSFLTANSSNSGNGGNIALATRNGNIFLNNGSYIRSNSNLGNGGAITLSTSNGNISLNNGSYLQSDAGSNGGAITLATNTGDISLDNVSYLRATAGLNGGDIALITNTGNISLDNLSYLRSYSLSNGNSGNGGDIALITNTGNISLDNGADVRSDSTSYFGNSGNGGDIALITSTGNISLDNGSRLYSSSSSPSVSGNGGNIALTTSTGNISLDNGSRLHSETRSGNGGAITLTSTGNISLDNGSFLLSRSTNSGNGGMITLSTSTGKISLDNVSYLRSTSGSGNGGDIALVITNGNIFLDNGSYLQSDAGSNGGAITLTTNTGDISLDNVSYLRATAGLNGGDIALITNIGNISLDNRSHLRSYSLSNGNSGNGGNIALVTTNGNISLDNGADVRSDSTAYSGNAGDGGTIILTVSTGNISLNNASFLTSNSSSDSGGNSGNGGAISLTSNGNISLDNVSSLRSFSTAKSGIAGNGGEIALTTNGKISLNNGSFLASNSNSTSSSGGSPGNGGAITLTSNGNISLDRSVESRHKTLHLSVQGSYKRLWKQIVTPMHN